jgi:hypothetical protein
MKKNFVGVEIVDWVQLKKHSLLKSHYTSTNRKKKERIKTELKGKKKQ